MIASARLGHPRFVEGAGDVIPKAMGACPDLPGNSRWNLPALILLLFAVTSVLKGKERTLVATPMTVMPECGMLSGW